VCDAVMRPFPGSMLFPGSIAANLCDEACPKSSASM